MPLSGFTRQHILGYAFSLAGYAPATIERRLAVLRSLWTYLQDLGECTSSPVRSIPTPKGPKRLPRWTTEEQIGALLDVVEVPWQRAALVLLATTGMRRSEVCGLRFGDVNLRDRILTVRGKGGKERLLPISADLEAALREYLPHRPRLDADSPLIVTRSGQAPHPHTLGKMVTQLCARAGIAEELSPHSFRHGFATRLLRAGVDLRTTQELLGHSSVATTSKYLHTTLESKRAAVEALALKGGADGTKPTR